MLRLGFTLITPVFYTCSTRYSLSIRFPQFLCLCLRTTKLACAAALANYADEHIARLNG